MPLTDIQRQELKTVVHRCREILLKSLSERLQADYGIHPNGKIEEASALPNLGRAEKRYRQRLVTQVEHRRAGLADPDSPRAGQAAVDLLAREIAFTHLNRLCAFKMMAARKIVRDPVGKGTDSAGFVFWCAREKGLAQLPTGEEKDAAYREFLDWQAGQLAGEMEALFSPDDPASGLYPPPRVLAAVLDQLNRDDLAPIWEDDETIGWVYQFFTPRELLDTLRKASAAPRDSYEMAVRNQFFTPRYVVEFLTDNALGRTWWEMRGGDTQLAALCRYLVTPNPALPRAKKDPRDIRVIDPASGSGHFLLYAFNLFLVIYAEAYDDPDLGPALQKEFPDPQQYRQAVPALILAHNLHGIDIDRRAAQIAALALYLRAQREWHAMGVKREDRPAVTRTRIVCAEPMPGDSRRLEEFVQTLEHPALGQFVRNVFEKMKLAGVAGSLLKIESDLRDDIAEARRQWQRRGTRAVQPSMDMGDPSLVRHQVVQHNFDLEAVTEEAFFEQAEGLVLAALKRFAESVSASPEDDVADALGLYRRLFRHDAAQGFAFLDLCRERYDVVLMNPPFGDAALPSKPYLESVYGDTKGDVYKAFVECFGDRLVPGGMLGVLSSRTGFFLGQSADWRERVVLRLFRPLLLADLGAGVLDALVETAAYVLRNLTVDERKALTLSLLGDLQKVPGDSKGFFSLNKYMATRGGLKRHQAQQELDWLVSAGFAVHLIGDINPQTGRKGADKFSINGKALRDAFTQPKFPLAGTPLVCLQLFTDRTNAKKEAKLSQVLADHASQRRFVVDPTDFNTVPGAPFAYWVDEPVRQLFIRFDQFEGEGREARLGDHPSDDMRWLRLSWETPLNQSSYNWLPYQKGGQWSPYYCDIHLRVDWDFERQTYRGFFGRLGRSSFRPSNYQYFLRDGLTWPRRTSRGMSVRCLPAGCVFSDKGPSAFVTDKLKWLALLQSAMFAALVKIQLAAVAAAARSYEVGIIQTTPVPDLARPEAACLSVLALKCVNLKRDLDTANETGHIFQIPALARYCEHTLAARAAAWAQRLASTDEQLNRRQQEIDNAVFELYGIESDDRQAIEEASGRAPMVAEPAETGPGEDEGEEDTDAPAVDMHTLVAELVSYCVGCAFGRFDVRVGTGERVLPPLPDPFAPLPVCSPGMLTGDDGLPLPAAPAGYPIGLPEGGILVDDADEGGNAAHPDDLVERVRAVLALLFGDDRADAIEREACTALGVETLRDYFRRPAAGGFWADHIKRYSKSRRKAPIYWLLQSSRRNYALWLYCHKIDGDTLYKALINFAEPKAQRERDRLEGLRAQRATLGESGKDARQMERRVDKQEALVAEAEDFCTKLRRAADRHLVPDLNDGVVLTIAPLHELTPWSEAKRYWDELSAGKYPWSGIAAQMRDKGLAKEARA